jgi:aryl-alcohol dehydrogenase-like predicted oxidoreductase
LAIRRFRVSISTKVSMSEEVCRMTERNQAASRTPEEPPLEPGTTGRYVITLDPEATHRGLDALRRIGLVPDTIFEGAGADVDAAQLADQEATVYYKGSGIVVAGGVSREQLERIRAAAEAADNPVTSVQPEFTYKAI